MDRILIYLLQVAVCHAGFFLLYKVLYEKLIWFQWNRAYLLTSVFLGFLIPAVRIGVWEGENVLIQNLDMVNNNAFLPPGSNVFDNQPISTEGDATPIIVGFLFIIYVFGVLLQLFKLFKGLLYLRNLIKNNSGFDTQETFRVVNVSHGPAVFSFFNFIFINRNKCSLTRDEEEQIIFHEHVHIQKKHTYDLIFMEVAAATCWFNPLLWKLKQSLVQIHEYQADKRAVSVKGPDGYFKLVLKLAQSNQSIPLIHHFSYSSLRNRINMLHNKNNSKMKKFRFIMVLPVVLAFVIIFSCTNKSGEHEPDPARAAVEEQLIINNIKWEGNELFSDALLSKVIGVEKGMAYDRKLIDSNISYKPEGDDLGALYIDRGYAYFYVDIQEDISNDKIDLTFNVQEGETVYISNVVVKGNKTRSAAEVEKLITIKRGELFSRKELVESQKNLSESGWFIADDIFIQPVPQEDFRKMDIEFTVIEI